MLDDMTFQVIIDDESFEVTPDELDIQYNADAAAAEAYNFGRDGSFFARVGAVLRARMSGYAIDFSYTYNLEPLMRLPRKLPMKLMYRSPELHTRFRMIC